jgi:hypothetical protein
MTMTQHNPKTLVPELTPANLEIWEELADFLGDRALQMETLAQQLTIYWNSGNNPGPLGNPSSQSNSPSSEAVKAAQSQPNLSPARTWMLNQLLDGALAVEQAWAADQTVTQAQEPSYQAQPNPFPASQAPVETMEPFLDEMAAQIRLLFPAQIAGIFSALVELQPKKMMELMQDPAQPALLQPMPLLETLVILEHQISTDWGNLNQRLLDQNPLYRSPEMQTRIQAAAQTKMQTNEQIASRIGKALQSPTPLTTLLNTSDFMRALMKTPAAPLHD